MFIKFLFLFIINSLFSKNYFIEPILFSEYSSSGKDWITSKRPITTFGAGLEFFYEKNNFIITSKYIQLGILGEGIDTSFYSLTNQQSLPYIDKSKDSDGYWSEFSEAKISYYGNNYNIYFGKFDRKWGPGVNAIHLSNKAPSYPQLGFDWKINDNLRLYYFHGFLVSGIIDSSYNYYYNSNNNLGRSINVKRSIAGHRLEWIINEKLLFALNETVIYAFRGLDLNYSIPVIPFYPIENYLGDTDNIQMGFDLRFNPTKNKAIYLSFFMDELTPEWLFNSKNHNWFAWQLGFNSKIFLNKLITWGFEYNWTDQRIYKHKFNVNDFYSHNEPLGFWAGPHSQELILFAQKKLKDLEINLNITTLKRGLNDKSSIQDNYRDKHLPRFHKSIIVEEKIISSFYLVKHYRNRLSGRISFSNIDFKNVVVFEANDRASLKKNSIDISFFYNIK